jgi:hypothetical protein
VPPAQAIASPGEGGAAPAALAGLPPSGAWPLIAASALVHVAYNLSLMASYQLGAVNDEYVREQARIGHRWRNPVWRHHDGSVAES